MGIKDLKKLIKPCVQERSLEYYRGKRVAIDVSLYMYKFAYYSTTPLNGFRTMLKNLQNNYGIIPIFVFDGEPQADKDELIAKRKEIKEKSIEKCEVLQKQIDAIQSNVDDDDAGTILMLQQKLMKQKNSIIDIKSEYFTDLQIYLTEQSIQWCVAGREADQLCSKLSNDGSIDAVITEDMDALTFGCNYVITGYSNASNDIKEYGLASVLKYLDLDYPTFVDLCILCGCDYVPRLHRIGIKTALKHIRKYNRIEVMLDNITHKEVPDNYVDRVKKARDIFLEYHHIEKK